MATTIKKITTKSKTWNGKTTISYLAALEDGTEGYFNPQDPGEFKEGDTVEYTSVEKTSTKGKYNVLTMTKTQAGVANKSPQSTNPKDITVKNNINPATPKTIEEYKVNAAIEAMGFVYEAFSAERVDAEKIEEYQKKAANLLWSEIDEIFGVK